MKTAQLLTITAACTVGLGFTAIKDAYGADESQTSGSKQVDVGVKTELELSVEVETTSGKPAEVVGVDSKDLVLPTELHGQKLAVPAKLFKPKWSKKVGKGPAILLMHGSGGLTKMPNGAKDGPCSPELEPQFARWGKRLAELGYVVLMPSSYSARGFCDMHVDTGRIPDDFDDRPEAVLSRIYDMDAASRYLCERDEVDCDRMGVLGFSHGATMAMLALHWQMDHAIESYREHELDKVDIDVPDLKPGRPEFQVGVAYYPGCGTDGVLPMETDDGTADENKYFPTADLYVLHAEEDPLVDICSQDYGSGARQKQSAQVAQHLGVDDTYHLEVYDQADHGFDNAGGSGSDEKGNASGDVAARDAALKVALKQLHDHLN